MFEDTPLTRVDIDYIVGLLTKDTKTIDSSLDKLTGIVGNLAETEILLEGESEVSGAKDLKQRLMKALQEVHQINLEVAILINKLQTKRGPGPD